MDRTELLITQDNNEKNHCKGGNCPYEQNKTKCFDTAPALPATIFFHLMKNKSTKGNATL
jgi:hypothetical protein